GRWCRAGRCIGVILLVILSIDLWRVGLPKERAPAMRVAPQHPHDDETTDIDYVGRARELGLELAAAAEEIERRRELPEAIVEALIERGLFRLLLPRTFGGAELRPAAYVEVIKEIADRKSTR